MTHEGPNWIAPREGQDWRDEDVLAAVDWLKGFVPRAEMERRLEAARARLTRAGEVWRNGESADAYDPADAAAWWILQGESFGDGREWTAPDMLARTVPYLTRLGRELDRIRMIPGAEERVEKMMNGGRAAVEPAIYELLVALAWSRPWLDDHLRAGGSWRSALARPRCCATAPSLGRRVQARHAHRLCRERARPRPRPRVAGAPPVRKAGPLRRRAHRLQGGASGHSRRLSRGPGRRGVGRTASVGRCRVGRPPHAAQLASGA